MEAVAILDVETRAHLGRIENEKRRIIQRTKALIVSDQLKNLDFSKKDKYGFVEYYPGVFVRDITSDIAAREGLTNLHIMCKCNIEIDPHEHTSQSQMIMIKEGHLRDLDDDNNGEYYKNDTFYVRKNKMHRVKYFAGSQYLITFMPQLNEVE
jgi:hypothetical protein